MKKLIVATMIIGSAIASQASAVSWKLTSTDTDANGATVYAIVGSYSTAPVFKTLADLQSLAYNSTGIATTTRTTPTYQVSTTAQTLTSSALTTGSPNLYLVLVNSDESGYYVGAVTDMSSKIYEPGSSSPGTLTIKENSVSFTSFGGSGDVPEPTSAMLLLLGVAGLALRRKQA